MEKINPKLAAVYWTELFWARFSPETVSPSVALFYFYLMRRITGSGDAQKAQITDLDVARVLGVSRNKISDYRNVLVSLGLLKFYMIGRGPAGAVYYFPVVNGSTGLSVCAESGMSTPEVSVSATASKGAVTVQTAEELDRDRERASQQAREIMRTILSPYSQATLQVQLSQNRIDYPTYHALLQEVIADWVEAGVCHDDYQGNFDLKNAVRHLQNSIRKKAYVMRTMPIVTRAERRADIVSHAYAQLDSVQIDPLAYEEEVKPF